MLLLFLLLFSEHQESKQITSFVLEGQSFPVPTQGYIRFADEGSLLGWSKHEVWHWNAAGKLLRHFGRFGQGPGEFQGIDVVHWTGKHYWVVDGSRLISSVFDADGNFLFWEAKYFRDVFMVGNRLFCLEIAGILSNRKYPRVLQECRLEIDEQKRTPGFEAIGEKFKKVTKRQREFGNYNFKRHFVAQHGQKLLILNEIEPKMWIYTKSTREHEQTVPDTEPWEGTSIALSLRNWVDAPSTFPSQMTRAWWFGFSRLNWISKEGKRLIIGYLSPNEERTGFRQVVDVLSLEWLDGRSRNSIFLPGQIIGTQNDKVYSWEIGDDGQAVVFVRRLL